MFLLPSLFHFVAIAIVIAAQANRTWKPISRDVIGHVTTGLGMGHFLLVVLWTQVSISNGFRDIPPQTSCAHRHNAKSSLRMRVSRHMFPLM